MAQRHYKMFVSCIRLYMNTILTSTMVHRVKYLGLLVVVTSEEGVLVRLTEVFNTISIDALCVLAGMVPLHLELSE